MKATVERWVRNLITNEIEQSLAENQHIAFSVSWKHTISETRYSLIGRKYQNDIQFILDSFDILTEILEQKVISERLN